MVETPCSYQLLMHIKATAILQVGRRGEVLFPAGLYVYTGSGKRGLETRLRRHQSKAKTLHWHIDFLLADSRVDLVGIVRSVLNECDLNQKTEGKIVVKGFGSSDCQRACGSHLKKVSDFGPSLGQPTVPRMN